MKNNNDDNNENLKRNENYPIQNLLWKTDIP